MAWKHFVGSRRVGLKVDLDLAMTLRVKRVVNPLRVLNRILNEIPIESKFANICLSCETGPKMNWE